MNTFTVNGKKYNVKPFDFGLVVDLEDMGFQIEELGEKDLKLVRAYFGLCANMTIEESTLELQNHIVNGGSFEELFSVMGEEINKSDFFRHLFKAEEEETPTNEEQKKKTTKKAE